jgi:hypothetical protein
LGTNPKILSAAFRSCLADTGAASALWTTNFIWLFLPLIRFVANANEVTVEGEWGQLGEHSQRRVYASSLASSMHSWIIDFEKDAHRLASEGYFCQLRNQGALLCKSVFRIELQGAYIE